MAIQVLFESNSIFVEIESLLVNNYWWHLNSFNLILRLQNLSLTTWIYSDNRSAAYKSMLHILLLFAAHDVYKLLFLTPSWLYIWMLILKLTLSFSLESLHLSLILTSEHVAVPRFIKTISVTSNFAVVRLIIVSSNPSDGILSNLHFIFILPIVLIWLLWSYRNWLLIRLLTFNTRLLCCILAFETATYN